jgi:hypothetical protein
MSDRPICLRFSLGSSATGIAERRTGTSARAWFNRPIGRERESYQAVSGPRAVVPRPRARADYIRVAAETRQPEQP